MPEAQPPLVSIVVPICNEAETIEELHARIRDAVSPLGTYEIVAVDDGSVDGSWERLLAVAAQDVTTRLIRLSRNFGHQAAISAGLHAARGDSVVFIDGDLQDPPELIPQLVERWREGFDVVYAVRSEREGESRTKLLTASLFYKLMRRMAGVEIPEQAGDFRLLSRRAADALAAMPERARFLRGMTSWLGFRQTGVPYVRSARQAGATKYTGAHMVRFAIDAITSFTTAPIRLVGAAGLVVVLLCGVYLVYTIYLRLFTDDTVPGWTSVIVVVLLIGGANLLSLAVIGQYVARVFDEVKERPLYIVDEVVEPGGGDR